MFTARSTKLERIDTGDYTAEEYDLFLKEIRFVNRYVGDNRALRRSLLADMEAAVAISVLDVGAGSGELLRTIAKEKKLKKTDLKLVGLDMNQRSANSIMEESQSYDEIHSVRGDAMMLPFDDGSFDYVVSSLFAHHLTNDQIVKSFKEMARIATKRFYVIDLHRHPVAYRLYRLMCFSLGISELVTQDGSLSILRGFNPLEMEALANRANISSLAVNRSFPFRLILSGSGGPSNI
jgi:ubiquinone/menaquinone biosynthesis C-methylase UbiE